MKRLIVIIVAAAFCLSSSVVFAKAYRFYIVKDKKGVCKVIEADKKTPKTLAGPYKTRENAEKAKATKCPTKKK
jgi:hypothetical protein